MDSDFDTKTSLAPIIIGVAILLIGIVGVFIAFSGSYGGGENNNTAPIVSEEAETNNQAGNIEIQEETNLAGSADIEKVSEVVVINLSGENYKFSKNEIRVKKGDRVKIVFKSTGGFHNWVVDEFNASTERVTKGNTSEVEFIADNVGVFEYYCSVGNHRELGMTGTLIVE